jgi:hypothetical protein
MRMSVSRYDPREHSLVRRLDDGIYLYKVWRHQAIIRVVSLDFFSSFLLRLVLYDLQVELFLLKGCQNIKCALSTIFAGLQFTTEQCESQSDLCHVNGDMAVFGRPCVFWHVQKRTQAMSKCEHKVSTRVIPTVELHFR